jgi:hypothetical protein
VKRVALCGTEITPLETDLSNIFFRWQLVFAEKHKSVYQKICKHTGLSTFEHKLVIKKFAAGFSTIMRRPQLILIGSGFSSAAI